MLPQPTTATTPKEREKQKNELQRAQDIAYTINHAVVCTVADVFGAPVNALTQKYLGASPIGCNDPSHNHGKKPKRGFMSYLGHVAPAEIAADVAAVPITIAIQRMFPGFMAGLSKTLEPLFGDIFKIGAKAGGKSWAKKHGLDPNGPEAKEKANEIYRHEADHLAQAGVWTAAAFGLNVGIQHTSERIRPPKIGRPQTLKELIVGKGVGSTITSVALVTFRGFMPSLAERSDDYFSRKVFIPLSRKLSGWFGLSKDTIDTLEQQEAAQDKYWDDKIAKGKKQTKEKAAEQPAADIVAHSAPKSAVSAIAEHQALGEGHASEAQLTRQA